MDYEEGCFEPYIMDKIYVYNLLARISTHYILILVI